MRTICKTVDDFLENLRIELTQFGNSSSTTKQHPIHRKAIYLTQIDVPIEEDKLNAVRFDVMIQIGAVVVTEEGEYLLECIESQGIDYRDASNEKKGTEQSELTVARIEEFCKLNQLTIRPGSLSY